jgi:Ala-tRNA(Pro) deacylase
LPTSPDALLARLVALGIDAVTHSHPPVFTVEENRALRGQLPGGHCKNLFLRDKKERYWLVVALEEAGVDLKSLNGILGASHLSFASAARLWAALGVRPGSVTPFALINDSQVAVTVVLQKAMLDHDPLNFHPLSNDRTTAIGPSDLLRFIRACGHEPLVIDFGQTGKA